ncbi:hypothetical protein A1O3_08007 [Capronia epimyces CBS 606.96]|uniref:HIG1 domain-containing protein n=1 Tax=Capronia epimyces CBS 606.96 TaxID=1182542 RepID=W9YBH8_9EURO|nr:uncharacterized protein A1O3_08007 [Capronia epimyces CBS 606.96]EXJ79724.1 hypothetical protein A1O3_08007 [Capronia epimyces CBS 606.96]
MPPPSHVKDIAPPEHLTSVAASGFASGVLRFGTISLLTHFLLNRTNPIYRGLTVQFKVYIQISAMTLGGCIFAEKQVTDYNNAVRRRNRALERSRRAWSEEMEIREQAEQRATKAQMAAAAKTITDDGQ